jgi:arsenite-transporting ATPase
VVDCAPTAETLRLLALPEALDWYLAKLYPVERRVVRALRPVLGQAVGLPIPRQPVLDAAERLHEELLDVQGMLRAPTTSVRLVLTPESVVVAEARRTLTSLALYGYQVDGVIANRVFPEGGDAWRQGWADAQREQLADIEDSFAPLPIHRGLYRAGEPVGTSALLEFARDIYGDADPFIPPPLRDLLEVRRTKDGYQMAVALPLAERRDIDLTRVGEDLVLTVGGRRRVMALPSALRRCSVSGARLDEGRLRIDFVPDRSQWPSTPDGHAAGVQGRSHP